MLFYQGNYQEADVLFSELIEIYGQNYKESSEDWGGVANALRNRTINRLQRGLYREVLPDFLESLSLYEERGFHIHHAQTLVMLSDVYLELGDYDKT